MGSENILARLSSLNAETVVFIAARSALRVFPIAKHVDKSRPGNAQLTLATARAVLTSSVAAVEPSTEVKKAARNARAAARSAFTAYGAQQGNAFNAASRAVGTVFSDDQARSGVRSIHAAADAASWTFNDRSNEANSDSFTSPALSILDAAYEDTWFNLPDLVMSPVWRGNKEPEWLLRAVEGETDLTAYGQEWSFWRRWYDGFLRGQHVNWNLQKRIALIDDMVWEIGPDAIAAEIERIEAEWLAEKLPQAEEIWRGKDGRYEVLPVATDPDLMIDRLFRQLDFSLDVALRGHNVSGFNDMCAAYKYLDHTRKNCRDDPNAVHMHLRLAREIIEGHLKSGTYRSEDGLTALVNAMERHEVQLRADHPVVRAAHETFVAQRIRELDDEKRLQIAAEFRGVSEYSKDRLQEEYGLDAETLESDTSAEAQSDAVKRSGGRSQKMSLIERASNTAKDIDGSAAYKATGLMLRLNKLAELLSGLF